MKRKIRSAKEGDVPSLVQLCKVLGFEGKEKDLLRRMKEIESFGYHNLLISEDEKNIVTGFVHFFIAPSLLTIKTVEIGGLAVLDRSWISND